MFLLHVLLSSYSNIFFLFQIMLCNVITLLIFNWNGNLKSTVHFWKLAIRRNFHHGTDVRCSRRESNPFWLTSLCSFNTFILKHSTQLSRVIPCSYDKRLTSIMVISIHLVFVHMTNISMQMLFWLLIVKILAVIIFLLHYHSKRIKTN